MGYILVSRKKGTNGKFRNAGPYEYAKKSQFGSLARIRKNNIGYEFMIIDKRLLGHT